MTSKKYRHYKGSIYTVVCEATQTEDWEKLVVYTDGTNYWARPSKMFFGEVLVNGVAQPRFTPLPDLPETLDETTERWQQEAKAEKAKSKDGWVSTVGMENDWP